MRQDIIIGSDGIPRCGWAVGDADYEPYHDNEWGVPFRSERDMFEKVCLEGFQAGLSWITILRRRPAFRVAFENFEPERVAALSDSDLERLVSNAAIIRNRAKIESCRTNARIVTEMHERGESLVDLVWSFAPPVAANRPRTLADIPAITPEATQLSQELRHRGFRFVGPTTMYALMQSEGLVNDHLAGCHRAPV